MLTTLLPDGLVELVSVPDQHMLIVKMQSYKCEGGNCESTPNCCFKGFKDSSWVLESNQSLMVDY